jgi:hypothetical protein
MLVISLWLGFAAGAAVGLLVTGALDADPATEDRPSTR